MNSDMLKQYLWYLLGILGVVLFWAGMWDGIGNLSYLSNPLISLGAGVILLSCSKYLFPDNVPFLREKHPAEEIVKSIHQHPQKHLFHLKYDDHIQNKEMLINAKDIYKIEKEFVIFKTLEGELFLPLRRVKEILHQGKLHWKK